MGLRIGFGLPGPFSYSTRVIPRLPRSRRPRARRCACETQAPDTKPLEPDIAVVCAVAFVVLPLTALLFGGTVFLVFLIGFGTLCAGLADSKRPDGEG